MSDKASRSWRMRLGALVQGPYTLEQLRVMAKRGELSRIHSVSADGVSWVDASAVRELWSDAKGSREHSAPSSALQSPDDPPLAESDFEAAVPRGSRWSAAATARANTMVVGGLRVSIVAVDIACVLVIGLCVLLPVGRGAEGVRWWWQVAEGGNALPYSIMLLLIACMTCTVAVALAVHESRARAITIAIAATAAVQLSSIAAGLGPARAWLVIGSGLTMLAGAVAMLCAIWHRTNMVPQWCTYLLCALVAVIVPISALTAMNSGVLSITSAFVAATSALTIGLCVHRAGKGLIQSAAWFAIVGVVLALAAALLVGSHECALGGDRFAVLDATKWQVAGICFTMLTGLALHETWSVDSESETDHSPQEESP